MKVLNISLEKSVIDPSSAAAQRMVQYGKLVDAYSVVTFSDKKEEIALSPRVQVYTVKKGGKIRSLFSLSRTIKNILTGEKFDVLTVQDIYFVAFLVWRISRRFRIPFEIQVHGFEKFVGIRKMLAAFVLKKAHGIRTVSERLKNELIQNFGVSQEKITVVPIFFEPEAHRFIRDFSRQPKKLLTVGRLVIVKNISYQLHAFAKLKNFFPHLELWVVGEGPEKDRLMKKATDLHIENSVRFLGWKTEEELKGLYKEADIFLLTSHKEGWPRVALEAASFALPLVLTNTGVAGELFEDGKSARVLSSHEGDELVIALKELLGSQELRKHLGQKAQEKVYELPSQENIGALYKKSWDTTLQHSSYES